jgi:N-acetylmuramoyl-L-alanine amidase CwlA
MTPEYITVHNTANDASANNEVQYMINNSSQVSYHIAVDDVEAVQGLPLDRNGWHCGDGNGTGNRKSIGVEICYSRSGGERYRKAEQNAIKVIAQLLRERGWGIDRVKKHQDWSGKYCPHRILDEGRWESFKAAIQKELQNKEENQMTNNEPSEWAKADWDRAVYYGYFDGTNPRGNITREETAIVINRLIDKIVKYHIEPLEQEIEKLKQK